MGCQSGAYRDMPKHESKTETDLVRIRLSAGRDLRPVVEQSSTGRTEVKGHVVGPKPISRSGNSLLTPRTTERVEASRSRRLRGRRIERSQVMSRRNIGEGLEERYCARRMRNVGGLRRVGAKRGKRRRIIDIVYFIGRSWFEKKRILIRKRGSKIIGCFEFHIVGFLGRQIRRGQESRCRRDWAEIWRCR
jgi:hypothetical protein